MPEDEEKRFRELVLDAVDYGLGALGETVKPEIYFQIRQRASVAREEIPEKLEEFTKALRQIIGAGGAVMERLIAKRVYANLGLSFRPRREYGLVDYVNEAREQLQERASTGEASGQAGRGNAPPGQHTNRSGATVLFYTHRHKVACPRNYLQPGSRHHTARSDAKPPNSTSLSTPR